MGVDLNLINLLAHFTLPWFIPWTRQERWKVRCAHNVICQALSNTIAHVLTTMPFSHAFASVIQTAFICGWYWCTWAINWASASVSPPLPVTDVTDRNQALRIKENINKPETCRELSRNVLFVNPKCCTCAESPGSVSERLPCETKSSGKK